jgi:hypothetical protein
MEMRSEAFTAALRLCMKFVDNSRDHQNREANATVNIPPLLTAELGFQKSSSFLKPDMSEQKGSDHRESSKGLR